jgi:type I restriction enzyme S subunit
MIPSTAALGDVAEFIRGITFKPNDVVPFGTSGSVRCMRTKNVQAEIDLSDVWSVDRGFVKRHNQYLKAGDLLVSSANSWNLVGKCCWVPEEVSGSTFGGFISALRPNREAVEPRYLYHWFSSDRIQAIVRSFGRQTTNISNLNIGRCLTLPIPLPSLRSQRAIAQVLDSVDALRAKRRETIALLDDLASSIFVDIFGDRRRIYSSWPTESLGKLLDFLTSGSRGWAAYYTDKPGNIFLRIQNVRRNELLLHDVAYVSPPDTAESRRTRVQPGDVLLSITADLGRTAVIPDGIGEAFINQHLSILRCTKLDPNFLSAYLSSAAGQERIMGRNRQAVKAGLNFDDVRSLVIPCPPRELQDEFSRRLASTRKVQRIQLAHLAELDALFASLQYRAFCAGPLDSLAA